MTLTRKQLSLNRIIMISADSLLISIAIFGVMLIRFSRDMDMVLGYDPYLIKPIIMVVIHIFCMSYFELYAPSSNFLTMAVCKKIIQSIAVASCVLFILYYFYPAVRMGRGVWVANLFVLPIILPLWRWLYTRWLSNKVPRERVLIVGAGELAKNIGHRVHEWKGLGMDVAGFLDKDETRLGYSLVNPKIIGCYEDVERIVETEHIDKIIIALPDRRNQLPMDLLLNCKVRGVRIEEGESFFEDVAGRIPLNQLRPSWMIFADGFYLFKIQKMIKRVGDVLAALVGLIVSIPVFLIVPLIIKLDSPGPVFFRQQRVGEYKTRFTMIKFRTMKVASDTATENKWSLSGEDRITRVGAFLRKTRIDEIPQLINVFKGEMSLVGPRPDIHFLMEQLDEKVPYYSLRYSVKPGITGWAQIKYGYVASVKEGRERHEYDLYYIKNLSIFLDAWIMLKTVQVMLGKIGGR